jgi:hypothetical protein
LLAAVKNAICGTPLGLVIDESVACNPLRGSVILLLDLGQRSQNDRVVKLDKTLRSHSAFADGHLQKRLLRCAGQCLYRCSSVAQLNECGKPAACGAATYSVIGRQLAGQALDNTSSRWKK